MKNLPAFWLSFRSARRACGQRVVLLSLVMCGLLSDANSVNPLAARTAAVAPFDTCTWTGSSGDWNDSAKWSCGKAPGPNDAAIINSGTVTVSTQVTVGTLTFNGGAINGSGELIVSILMNWLGGTMSGNGSTKIAV